MVFSSIFYFNTNIQADKAGRLWVWGPLDSLDDIARPYHQKIKTKNKAMNLIIILWNISRVTWLETCYSECGKDYYKPGINTVSKHNLASSWPLIFRKWGTSYQWI